MSLANMRREPFARVLRTPAVAVVLLANLAAAPTPPARSSQPRLSSKAVATRAHDWLLPYVEAGDFSGVVLIAQGQRILFERAYGKADFEHGVPHRLATRFRIASLSKTFTAAGIEQLLKQGRLRLTDTLDRFVDGIPNGNQITVSHLLLHQSGVGRPAKVNPDCLPEEELISQLRKAPPSFSPGERSSYSNEGYFLLAVILQKVAKVPYERFLQQNIFARLGMKNSGSACKELPRGDNANGHLPGGSERDPLPLALDQAVPIGPGSIYSTAGDLYRWLRAVDNDALFQVDRLQYPYGWGKRDYSGHKLIEQSGIVEGFSAHIALYPNEHIYAVVLSNVQSGFFNRIPKDVERVLFGGEVSRPPQVARMKRPSSELSEYTGTYRSAKIPVAQQLRLQGEDLYMQWADGPFLRPLIPTSKDSFYYRVEYASVDVERDEKGQISRAVWRWPQGEPLIFEKVAPPGTASPPPK